MASSFGNALYTGEKSFNIVGRRRFYFAIAIAAVILSVLVVAVRGANLGIEFRGGTEFMVSNVETTSSDPAVEVFADAGISEVRTAVVGTSAVRIQTEALDSARVEELRPALAEAYGVEASDITSTFVGPAWGADVTSKALQGMVIFLVLVGIVMTVYFRSWRMSLAGIVALLHDMVVTIGIYSLVGFEVTPASVIGFLTILGYSLYDTVVVFDKVRENTENLTDQHAYTYEEASNLAVNQTLVRSINTSVTGLLPVGAILFVGVFLLGAGTLGDIALALFIGMAASTISSVFIAAPLEVELRTREATIANHTADVLARRGDAEVSHEEQATAVAAEVSSTVPTSGRQNVVAGTHRGTRSQPKRKSRSHR